jgi:hypothetical protein
MPQAAVKTIKRGFVKKEAQKVADLLQDSDKILFNIVTTLEEMPVNEALDLYNILAHQLYLPIGLIFANKIYPPFPEREAYQEYLGWKSSLLSDSAIGRERPLLKKFEPSLLAYAESWRKRRSDNEFYLEKLKKAVPCEIYPVPLLFTPNVNLDFIKELAQEMTNEF